MLAQVLAWALLLAMMALLLAPSSPLGRSIKRLLVDEPAQFLLDMTLAKAGRIALLGPLFIVFVIAGPEMAAMMVMMGGDLAAVELLLLVWGLSVSGGLQASWRRLARAVRFLAALARRARRPRAGRAPPSSVTRRNKPRQDDKDEPGWAIA